MSLTTMRGELETLKARAQAIIDQYGAGGLTAEKNEELTKLTTKCVELAGQIKAERDLDDKKRDLNSLDEFLNKPQYKVPHGVGEGDTDTHKALRSAGWEIKGGLVYAPTSTGKMLEMYTEDVLLGDIPSVKDVGEGVVEFYRLTRRAFQPDYRKAYERYIRLSGMMHDPAMAYTRLTGDEQKALSEGTDTAGGFLVPPDIQAELLVRTAQQAVIRGKARVQATSRDILKWPMVQAAAATTGGLTSGGGSIFSSGFVGSWAGETPAFSDVDASFGSMDITIKKLRVATRLSNDFISDAVVNILSFLAQNGAENMALVEDLGFILGDGSSLQPLGILNAPNISTTDICASPLTTHVLVNDTTHPGPPGALIDLVYSLPPQYASRPSTSWLMRRSIEGKIRKYVDGAGRYLWPAMTQSAFGAVDHDLMGYSISNSDFMPTDGTATNTPVLFGDLSGYIIGQRAQITSTVLRERFADTDQTGIILWERVGGAVWNPDQFRLGIFTS